MRSGGRARARRDQLRPSPRSVTKDSEVEPSSTGGPYRIGQVASRLGVSERTIRYYDEIGLCHPSGHTPGGARRYTEADVAKLNRIRELQGVMGFNLEEIQEAMSSIAKLDLLRSQYPVSNELARAEILAEALDELEVLRAKAMHKAELLSGFIADLDDRVAKVRRAAER